MVKEVVVIIFWGGGRVDLCCLYAIGMREVEDTGEENI